MGEFRRGLKRMRKRGADMNRLKEVVFRLADGMPMPAKMKDHALGGEWNGWRDCHLSPDWVLIYRLTDEELILGGTGTHSDLFGC